MKPHSSQFYANCLIQKVSAFHSSGTGHPRNGLPILSTFMSSTYVVVFILDLTIQAIEKHTDPDINPGLRAFNSILRLEE